MITKITDQNEKIKFHPSLDIQNNTLVLGFRIMDENNKENNLYIIKKDGALFTTDKGVLTIGGGKFVVEEKDRLLVRLSQKWSVDGLNEYMESYSNPLSKLTSESGLFNELKNLIKDHIEMEEEADYSILTAWIIGTYFFPSFAAYPYIHIKAPKGSGKSQCLKLIQQTAFNAVKARATLPALRDTVDAQRGTFIMDQADILNKINMEDFLDILTDSYKRGGGSVRKMAKNAKSNWVVEEFDAYSPKVFGSIRQLPEDLRDRCIEIPLFKSNKNYPDIDEESQVWKTIRGKLYAFLIENFALTAGTYQVKRLEYRESKTIFGRKLELWLPIETMLAAMYVPKEIESAKRRFIARYEFSKFEASELDIAVITTIRELMGEAEEIVLRPQEIATEIDPELFHEIKNAFMTDKQRASVVGRTIKAFNISNEKLPRTNKGERYKFIKERVQKIYNGYFATDEEKDTPIHTEEKALISQPSLSESPSVS